MKTIRTFILTFARITMMYRPFFLSIITLIICSFLIAACGQQNLPTTSDSGTGNVVQNTPTTNDNGTGQQNTPTTNDNGTEQQNNSTTSDNGTGQQNTPTTNDNGTGNIVHNFRCTSGISRGVIVPPYPGALHITFLQATDTANFVQDELTIQADQNSPNTFTWTLRSTGEQITATITDPSIGAFNFGVTVLGFTKTLSMDPNTGQFQQASYWIAEVCDQWATDGPPAE